MSTSMLNFPSLSVMELACMLVEVEAKGSPRPLFRSKNASSSDLRGVSDGNEIVLHVYGKIDIFGGNVGN